MRLTNFCQSVQKHKREERRDEKRKQLQRFLRYTQMQQCVKYIYHSLH